MGLSLSVDPKNCVGPKIYRFRERVSLFCLLRSEGLFDIPPHFLKVPRVYVDTIVHHRPDPRRNYLWSALYLSRSALAVECRTLHIFHNSHKTNHFCSITPFSHDTEHNTNSQPRHTGENHSGISLATNISLLASLSIAVFSRYFHVSTLKLELIYLQ